MRCFFFLAFDWLHICIPFWSQAVLRIVFGVDSKEELRTGKKGAIFRVSVRTITVEDTWSRQPRCVSLSSIGTPEHMADHLFMDSPPHRAHLAD